MRRLTSLFILVMLVSLAVPSAAAAAAPSNDDITTPRIVGALPYSDGPYSTIEATTGPTDPPFCFWADLGVDAATVWYAFTPAASGTYVADTFGSQYDTTMYVGTSDGADGLDLISCTDDVIGSLQAAVQWEATAGTTYLIMVGTCCGEQWEGGGQLQFHLDAAPPAPGVEVTIDSARRSPSGAVTVEGTISCTGDVAFASVDSFVTQRQGRLFVFGYGFSFVSDCSATPSSWAMQIHAFDGQRFTGGRISVQTNAYACGAFTCAFGSASAELVLESARGAFTPPPVSPPVGPPVSPPAGRPKCDGPNPPPICPPVSPPVSQPVGGMTGPTAGGLGGIISLAATVPAVALPALVIGGAVVAGMLAARAPRRDPDMAGITLNW